MTLKQPAIRRAQLDSLHLRLKATGQVVTSRDLEELGFGRSAIRSLLRCGELTRVCQCGYVGTGAYTSGTPRQRHVLLVRLMQRTWPENVVASHQSAALVLGMPLLAGVDLSRAHGTRIDGAGQYRRSGASTIHTGPPPRSIGRASGVRTVDAATAVAGVAAIQGLREAVVAGDFALHTKLITVQDLRAAATAVRNPQARSVVRRAVEMMDGRMESPGESLLRLVAWDLGIALTPQVVIEDERGFVGRVDFLVTGTKVVLEFDGMVKYQSAEDLRAEKQRELRLQRAGFVVIRIVWDDLAHPGRVGDLIQSAIRQASSR